MEIGLVREADQRRKLPRSLDEFRRQIDSGDMRALRVRDVPRRPADAAADIERERSRLDRQLREKIVGRPPPAGVKLVHRSEVVGRRRIGVDVQRPQRVEDMPHQRSGGVVLRDLGLDIGHRLAFRPRPGSASSGQRGVNVLGRVPPLGHGRHGQIVAPDGAIAARPDPGERGAAGTLDAYLTTF